MKTSIEWGERGGRERLPCQKCHFVTLKTTEMGKRRLYVVNENKNACLELVVTWWEGGREEGSGKGRGEKAIRSQLMRDGCHHCKQGSEETSSAGSALHCWSRQHSSTTHGHRVGTEWGPRGAGSCRGESAEKVEWRSMAAYKLKLRSSTSHPYFGELAPG